MIHTRVCTGEKVQTLIGQYHGMTSSYNSSTTYVYLSNIQGVPVPCSVNGYTTPILYSYY